MLGKRFARIVEECLHRLDRGEDLLDILADFPAEAEQLKPLLLIAMASRSMAVPLPNQSAQRLGKNQMFLEMDQVGAALSTSSKSLPLRLKGLANRVVNAFRARQLVRPAPNYRLAVTSILVLFGSGLFFLSASASTGDLFSSLVTDFQQILSFINIDQSDNAPYSFRKIFLFGEESSPFTPNPKTKVTFQIDVQDDQDPEFTQVTSLTKVPPPSNIIPDEIPDDRANDDTPTIIGPDDVPPPFPHPASFVSEVVSDTAKEKNPVWDQLPFNQTDQEESDDCPDQETDCDEDDEKVHGPPSWVLDLINDKKDDDTDDGGDND